MELGTLDQTTSSRTLYKRGIEETDIEERNRIYLRMGEIMEDTGAYVWITHEPPFFMHRDWLSPGLDPSGQMDFTQMSRIG